MTVVDSNRAQNTLDSAHLTLDRLRAQVLRQEKIVEAIEQAISKAEQRSAR